MGLTRCIQSKNFKKKQKNKEKQKNQALKTFKRK